MQTIIIIIHLFIVLALVGIVLIQRSEGGGLGIGGGGGSGLVTARSAANILTRTTAILVVAFFGTSIMLGILTRYSEKSIDILKRIPVKVETTTKTQALPDQLGGQSSGAIPTPPAANDAPTVPPSGQPSVPLQTIPEQTAPDSAPDNKVPNSQ